jgi:enterochelin esterase-like enzyme
LYLLHGSGDDQTGWVQFGEVQHLADKAIAEGSATATVIVMPDANTGRRGYFNDIRGDWDYEDFFFKELMPHVEAKYRVKSEKRYRAVAGLSMGGGGTLMYAMHHPELFSSACPLSASVGSLNVEDAKKRYNRSRRGEAEVELEPVSDEQIEEYLDGHSALRLAESMPEKDLNSVRWYIDCGDDDFLYEGNSLLHIAMTKRKIQHEYRVRDGAHNWSYWRGSLPSVLSFVSEAFHQY